jgi:8-oxo-dGTP pyrophosphatase MutT (NUDIX family)
MLRRWLYQLVRVYWRIFRPTTLGARALVIRDQSVLLIRHTYIDGWYLPGGGVNRSESFHTAILRELMEECGLLARDVKLFGLYYTDRQFKSDHVAVYLVKNFEQKTKPSDPEIAEIKWFPLSDLPKETTPASRRRIQEYLSNVVSSNDW